MTGCPVTWSHGATALSTRRPSLRVLCSIASSCPVPASMNSLPPCAWTNADLAICRKQPAKTAWTQGTNPLTNRPTNPATSNGLVSSSKPSSTASSAETASPMRHLSDRMMYLLANLTVSDGRFPTSSRSTRLTLLDRVFRAPLHSRMATSTRVSSLVLRWIPANYVMFSRWSRG